jgi:hypothetical protein
MGVATSIAIGTTLATAGMSAAQASKQSRLQKQAEAAAAKAMSDARKKLEVNVYDKLSVKKEPYELAIEASNVAAAQALEAGRESERGVAATAGRVQMAKNEQQRQIATVFGQELTDLERLSATEDSRLRDIGVQLDLSEAEGAQKAARDAQEAKTAATEAAIKGGISAVGQGINAANLYSKNTALQRQALGQSTLTDQQMADFGVVKNGEQFGFKSAGLTQSPLLGDDGKIIKAGTSNLDMNVIANMDKGTYKDFIKSLTPDQRGILFTNKSFTDNYNPFKYDTILKQ